MPKFDNRWVEIELGELSDLMPRFTAENLAFGRISVDKKSLKLCARALEIERKNPGVQFGEALREARKEMAD